MENAIAAFVAKLRPKNAGERTLSARISAAAERALKLILNGAHPADAARRAGVHKATIYRMMARAGITHTAGDRRVKHG